MFYTLKGSLFHVIKLLEILTLVFIKVIKNEERNVKVEMTIK